MSERMRVGTVVLGLLLGSSGAIAAEARAFVGARVIDGTSLSAVEQATLLVRDGRVVSLGPAGQVVVPPGTERVDLAGRTIIPGLVNAHGHVGETKGLRSGPELYDEANVRRQLGLYARYGVTTVFALGGDQAPAFRLRDGQRAGPPPSEARLYVAGPIIVAQTPDEARARVDEAAAMKPDLVKIRVDDNLGTTPKMTPEVYRAVIDQAHRHGLRVAAHIFYLDDAKDVLRAGADFIAHSIRDRAVDDELVGLLKARDVCVCPTLTREVSTFVYESEPAFFKDPFFLREAEPDVLTELRDPKRQETYRTGSGQRYKKALEVAQRNLKVLEDRGVRVAFGTDTGPPARFQGYFEHMELELMAQAGLTPQQVLRSATGDAARCWNVVGQVGTLEAGAFADFVVLGKNPLEDIKNSRSIESVWIGGKLVPR